MALRVVVVLPGVRAVEPLGHLWVSALRVPLVVFLSEPPIEYRPVREP